MFVKGEHEKQFAYEAHTACDEHGFVLDVEVTAGNVHDSVAWDALYDKVTAKHDVEFTVMDAGYKTPWIAKKTLDDGKIPILRVTQWVRLKYAAMNLKKLANWSWDNSFLSSLFALFTHFTEKPPFSLSENGGFF